MKEPGDVPLHRGDDRLGQIGRVSGRQPLVRDHLQRTLLSRAVDHALHEVAALRRASVVAIET